MRGILGYQPVVVLDLILLSQLVVLPWLFFAIWQAKKGNYKLHSRLMAALTLVIFVAVVAFEWQVQSMGGLSEIARQIGREQAVEHLGFRLLFFFHLLLAGLLTPFWLYIFYRAVSEFSWRCPSPSPHGHLHRLLGKIAIVGALLISVTGILLYWLAFVK